MARCALPLLLAGVVGTVAKVPTQNIARCGAHGVCKQKEEDSSLLQFAPPSGFPADDPSAFSPRGRSAGGQGSGRSSNTKAKTKANTKAKNGNKATAGSMRGDGEKSGKLLGIGNFVKYAHYKGNLQVTGKLWLRANGKASSATAHQTFTYRLHGVDGRCNRGPGSLPNSCGIQIHQGSSCGRPTGGHLWNKRLLHRDPWQRSAYTTVEEAGMVSTGSSGLTIRTGYAPEDVKGKTVVVHDFRGVRIACAPITGFFHGFLPPTDDLVSMEVKDFRPFPGYTGKLRVRGTVVLNDKPGLTEATTGCFMSFILKDVDPKCSAGPGRAQNSCGVRLHKGSCSDGAVESFWNSRSVQSDPWASVGYTAVTSGSGRGTAAAAHADHDPVNLGVKFVELYGHAVVVHDFRGNPIACGAVSV